MLAYLILIAAVGLERIAELLVSTRNARCSFAAGAREYGAGHFPVMVGLHAGLLVGCVAEALSAHRHFDSALGWPMLALVGASQALRWWCIWTLGTRWNTRIIVVPNLPLVASGPYRWLRHPNYVAVVIEGMALPLVRTCWVTALVFTVANACLLRVRIRAENAALASAPTAATAR